MKYFNNQARITNTTIPICVFHIAECALLVGSRLNDSVTDIHTKRESTKTIDIEKDKVIFRHNHQPSSLAKQ